MISYERRILDNGLSVVVSQDKSTLLAAVNIIYKVGARNENPNHTGFAHLFEHLMFGGSRNVPDFDTPIQMATGENNAFTNNDYTNYYIVLPKENIETALWVESDRMKFLDINETSLELQKKVVIEEFNQRYLNKPYGDTWLLLRPLSYKVHPYRWNTIGMSTEHIENASLHDVQEFYDTYYNPSNAIISIVGDLEPEYVFSLVEKWFGDIKNTNKPIASLPIEPPRTEASRLEVKRDVPASMIYITYLMDNRSSREFLVCDIISDLLSNGNSSRLYQHIVKEKQIFSSVNAYITGDIDKGLFVIMGQVSDNIDIKDAEKALLEELYNMSVEPIDDYELDKVRNKFEANTLFGEINAANKALNLCFYEMLGDITIINKEIDNYRSISKEEVVEVCEKIFTEKNSTTLIYEKQ